LKREKKNIDCIVLLLIVNYLLCFHIHSILINLFYISLDLPIFDANFIFIEVGLDKKKSERFICLLLFLHYKCVILKKSTTKQSCRLSTSFHPISLNLCLLVSMFHWRHGGTRTDFGWICLCFSSLNFFPHCPSGYQTIGQLFAAYPAAETELYYP